MQRIGIDRADTFTANSGRQENFRSVPFLKNEKKKTILGFRAQQAAEATALRHPREPRLTRKPPVEKAMPPIADGPQRCSQLPPGVSHTGTLAGDASPAHQLSLEH